MQRFGRVLRLREGTEQKYENLHTNVWPRVLEAIRESGISNYSVFRYGRWLFSYFELPDELNLAAVSRYFEACEDCRKWEELMHELQERLPESQENLWWVPMQEVWNLPEE